MEHCVGDLYQWTRFADFASDLQYLHSGTSVLGGSDVTAAEMKEVVDLITG
jgi:hypothetical protein